MVQVLEVNNCVLEDFSGSKCPECNNYSFIPDLHRGETICNNCGLVISQKELDYSNERNIYSEEEKKQKSRVGDPITIFTPDISYCTRIFKKDTINLDYFRLAKRDRKSKKKQNISKARIILLRISANLRLSENIKQLGMYLCKKTFKKKNIQGYAIENVVASCLYYACRSFNLPISFKEIVGETSYNSRIFERSYKMLMATFNLKNPIVNPLVFVSRYVTELGLSFDFERKVLIVIQKIPSVIRSGLNPIVLCASVIYLISKNENIKVKQNEIAKITGITEISIRNNYRKLKLYFSNK